MGVKRLLALVVLITACKSAGTDPADERLSGSYVWTRSSGGIAGRTLTPASENYTVRFQFSGNQVTVFRNDSLKATSTFTVRGDEVTYQPSLSVFVFDQGIDTQTLRVIAADTIALADPCCDRYDHHFVRR
jgi:hypothetical protein